MRSCVIIGGGLAGLSSALYLSSNGISVTVLEQSPCLGGRASSRFHPVFNEFLDNGQHIIMGCYTETLEYMRLINATSHFTFQDELRICYRDELGNNFKLEAFGGAYPLNLLSGLMNYDALSFQEKLQVIKLLSSVIFEKRRIPDSETLLQWLQRKGQAENIRTALWDFLAIGALNTSTQKADAGIFKEIIKRIFFGGNFASTIILPKYDLFNTFIRPALDQIKELGGRVHTSAKVVRFTRQEDGKITVYRSDGLSHQSDYLVIAVPPFAVTRINGTQEILNPEKTVTTHSSILTAHILLRQKKLNEPFYGLLRSPVHWVFNHGKRLTVVISDADRFMNVERAELESMILTELNKYFHISSADVSACQVIKERRATFVPDIDNLRRRPGTRTYLPNVFLAGDWIDTQLPATIESAVLSGRMAAEAIMSDIKLSAKKLPLK